ncbi:MAG: hypothetical protein ACPGAL_03400 [Luminiphilus sp.]|nr:hypothetical protein [Aequoribacter fuscus]QHJ88291.1 hypothetical protein EYZ66_08255 [Aequoribacter fuscus]
MSRRLLFASVGISMLLAGCGQNDKSNETPDSDYQRRLIERLIEVQLLRAVSPLESLHQISMPISQTASE